MPAGFPLSLPAFSSCNVIPPFSLELQDSFWGGSAFSTEQARYLGPSIKVGPAVADGLEGFDFMPGTWMDVEAGQKYTMTAWVYPLTQTGTLDLTAWWGDSTSANPPIGSSFNPGAAAGTSLTEGTDDWKIPCPPAGQWTKIGGGTVVVPDGYDRMEPYFELNGDGPGLVIYVDEPVLCRVVRPVVVPDAPRIEPPAPSLITDDQIVSLHTFNGVQLYQFLPQHYTTLSWGRSQRDASRADLAVPPMVDIDRLPDIVPWLHWISVWDGERDILLWTGPIQSVKANRRGMGITAKDHAAYLSRTRNPTTRRWDAADPAWIAGELWQSMIEAQAVTAAPIIRADPEGERYDFQVVTDDQMLDQTISQLVDLGLRWTVVSGAPIIGPLGLDPVAVLGEHDFLGDGITFVRDGTAVYNDVLVRGPDNLARARTDYYGQNLQTIANIDSMFGVSNVQRAADAYIQQTGTVRTRLELGAQTVLHPDAPVSIDQLMPSARFVIEAQGIRQLMELTGVEVKRVAGASTVSVTMESVEPKLELDKQNDSPIVTLSGAAGR